MVNNNLNILYLKKIIDFEIIKNRYLIFLNNILMILYKEF